MRALILSVVLLTGCAGSTDDSYVQVVASDFHSPKIERELKFYVANFSTHATNHFYVGATKLDRGDLVAALAYWKEARILLNYDELVGDTNALNGHEMEAWPLPHWKLDRDTVDTPEDIDGSTYVITHHQWVDWMEQCISEGKLYVISLDEATNLFPNKDRPKADE